MNSLPLYRQENNKQQTFVAHLEMNYIEYKFTIHPNSPWTEILLAKLSESDFESFEETDEGLNAYVKTGFEDEEFVKTQLEGIHGAQISYERNEIKQQNWNAVWESGFKPILIDNQCYIRAEFHEPRPEIEYEIVIQPKMSFGTGHHQTTRMMLEYVLETVVSGKSVLDMGCGTSVLGILAKKRGATTVEGIDIDNWATENSLENAKRNQVEIVVKLGDASLLGRHKYDIILANINKNILMADIPEYIKCLNFANGELILSGLMEFDFDDINTLCTDLGLELASRKQEDEWIAMKYKTKAFQN